VSVSEANTTTNADGDPSPHRHLGLALIVICTAQLMVVLDASIVNVALPSIQHALHFSPGDLEWLVNAYTLAFGGLLLLGGRLGDLFGRRRVFMLGIALFTAASLLGGLAQSSAWILVARAVQGVGAAIASPTALALIASTFDEGRARDRAMGAYAAMAGAGSAIGVLLGGVLTEQLSWRWVFFVNLAFGAFILAAAPRVLGESSGREGRLDVSGAFTATIGMTFLVYGLLHAGTHSWGSPATVIGLGAGVALLATFVVIETRHRDPMLPLHLLADRNRSGAYLIMLAIGTAMFAMFYFLTLFMQEILGFSPVKTGFAYLPFPLTIAPVAGLAAGLVGRLGPRTLLMIGTPMTAGGLLWLSLATPTATYWGSFFGPMILIAGGAAMCFVPLTLAAVAGVRRHEQGIASALLNSGQQVGGSLGLAILGTIAATTTRDQLGRLAGAADALAHGAGSALPRTVHLVVSRAVVHGYSVAFRVGAGIMLVGFLLATFALTVKGPTPSTREKVDDAALEPVSERIPGRNA
jgi:EmrB/QacA subfamily drug resistance transporter